MGGFRREGDRTVLRLGDPSQGSPGYRPQTCGDDDFQFTTSADAFATYDFVEVPNSPVLKLVPGRPVRWTA